MSLVLRTIVGALSLFLIPVHYVVLHFGRAWFSLGAQEQRGLTLHDAIPAVYVLAAVSMLGLFPRALLHVLALAFAAAAWFAWKLSGEAGLFSYACLLDIALWYLAYLVILATPARRPTTTTTAAKKSELAHW
jgi:hypothetical protein